MKRMSKATVLVKYNGRADTYRLRDKAHDAFMNGLTANAKEYNRRADILDRELRDLASRTRFKETV
jgi:K+/H+ antiporter YhaU regulatory subunit KhtT